MFSQVLSLCVVATAAPMCCANLLLCMFVLHWLRDMLCF